MTTSNVNTAPFPTPLVELVGTLRYKDYWQFTLEDADRGQGSAGLTLCILIATPNSYNVGETRRVMHYMPVPPAAFDTADTRTTTGVPCLACGNPLPEHRDYFCNNRCVDRWVRDYGGGRTGRPNTRHRAKDDED